MYRYWTDNGACYYYDTGNYSNYEEILDAVIAQANQANIPFRYLQVLAYLRNALYFTPCVKRNLLPIL